MKFEEWCQSKPWSVFVVDSDAQTQVLMQETFAPYRNIRLELIGDAKVGWVKLEKAESPFNLIIMGWKMTGMNGPAMLNRVRQDRRYWSTPLLVVSEQVNRKDFRLLDEFPCTSLMEKPLTPSRVSKALGGLLTEHVWYEENAAMINRLCGEARSKPGQINLSESLKTLIADAPNPVPIGLLIGEALVDNGWLAQAEVLYKQLLARDGKSLRAMMGLGRVLYRQGKAEEAASHLRVAWRESPLNIARLCLMGEIELGSMDPDNARKHFHRALDVDEESPRAKAGIELCKSLEDHVKRNAGAQLPRNFASMCNTMAVSLVRAGDYTNGIAQYKTALQLIDDDYIAAQVMFNLGLGYLRWSKPEEARSWFAASADKGGARFTKALRYVEEGFQPKVRPATARPEAPVKTAKPSEQRPSQIKIPEGGDFEFQLDAFENVLIDDEQANQSLGKKILGDEDGDWLAEEKL